MSKQLSFAILGLFLTLSSVGCCCLGGHGMLGGGGCNRCAPCGGGCPTGGCPTGAGAPGGGYYAPQTGAFINGVDATQSAYLPGFQTSAISNTATIGAPITATPGNFATTAYAAPVNQLPTYH